MHQCINGGKEYEATTANSAAEALFDSYILKMQSGLVATRW